MKTYNDRPPSPNSHSLRIFILPSPQYLPSPDRSDVATSDKEPTSNQDTRQNTGKPSNSCASKCVADLDRRYCKANIREDECPPPESKFQLSGACNSANHGAAQKPEAQRPEEDSYIDCKYEKDVRYAHTVGLTSQVRRELISGGDAHSDQRETSE